MSRQGRLFLAVVAAGVIGLIGGCSGPGAGMPWIEVSPDAKGFVQAPSGKKFTPWGFNYDRDFKMRLLEDYWQTDWPAVQQHFGDMKDLGANVVRVHLQFVRFMDAPDKANAQSIAQLARLLGLAERTGLYLDITGLGCYRKKDTPDWYTHMTEPQRWAAQAKFWQAVAECCTASPAVFCYDLMNEPVVPGGRRDDGQYITGDLGGFSYVQFITLDPAGRDRAEIARQWIAQLSAAIRQKDRRHLITVGMMPGAKGEFGFAPAKLTAGLDFLCLHIYPGDKTWQKDVETVKGFAVGKPLVIEEIFPMNCSAAKLREFIEISRPYACGWISFYWGQRPEELRKAKGFGPAILLGWLEVFQQMKPQ